MSQATPPSDRAEESLSRRPASPREEAREARGSHSPARPVRHYTAELVTIFVGIVLALLADAAWDYRVERVRERQYLVGLRAELGRSAFDLAADQEVRTAALIDIATLVAASRGDTVLGDAEGARAINSLANYRLFSPARAVLDDLIDSGNLRVLRSDSLRFALQRYIQQLETLAVVEARERDFIAETVEPYLASALRMDGLLPLQSYDDPIEGAPANADRFRAMLRDDTFASLAFMRWERSQTASRFGRSLHRTIDALIAMVDAELGVAPPGDTARP